MPDLGPRRPLTPNKVHALVARSMPKRLELVVDRIECPKEVVSILMGLLGAAGIASTAIDVVADGDHVVSEVQVDPQADPKRVASWDSVPGSPWAP